MNDKEAPKFKCCMCCAESPLFHYRKTPDMGLFYSHYNGGNNVYMPPKKTEIETISTITFLDMNGERPTFLDSIATIKKYTDFPTYTAWNDSIFKK
jgi:hypothetical protein